MNFYKKLLTIAIATGLMTFAGGARAEGEVVETTNARTTDPFGVYLSLYGDPYPGLMGVNIAYNVYEFARVNAGIGTDDLSRANLTTLGAGVKVMVPNWSLTPVAGLNFATVLTNDIRESITSRGFSTQGSHLYVNVGADWQTAIGLNFGIGMNYSLATAVGAGYFNLGMFL